MSTSIFDVNFILDWRCICTSWTKSLHVVLMSQFGGCQPHVSGWVARWVWHCDVDHCLCFDQARFTSIELL